MNSRLLKYFLFISLIGFSSSNHIFAAETKTKAEISKFLESADYNRNNDLKTFFQQLEAISVYKAQFTELQSQLFNLLIAYKHMFSGEYEKAETKLLALINLNSTTDILKFRAKYALLSIHSVNKRWQEGLILTEELLAHSKLIQDVTQTTNGLIAIVVFFSELEQFESVINYSAQIPVSSLNAKQQCFIAQTTLEAKLHRLDPEQTSIFQAEIGNALNSCETAGSHLPILIIRTYLGAYHLEVDAPQQTISTLLSFEEEYKASGFTLVISEYYYLLAQAYFKLGNFKHAMFFAKKAEKFLSSQHSKQTTAVYLLLSELYENNGEVKLALDFFKLYQASLLAKLDNESTKALAYQLARHQSIQQQNEIRLLNNQNELLNNKNELLKIERSLTQSEAENTRLVVTLLSAIVALLAFFGYRSWHSQRRLKVLAEYDHLTKINNRGHFMALAEETMSLAERAHQTASCIILDLDKFKSINDTYGHAAGDWALKAVVEAVKPCIRDHDIFARLGGEEFVILLPSCDIQAATFVTEKCLKVIEAIDTADSGNEFKITASFGITTTRTSGYQVTSLINDADKALYQSKENGRNQMTIFTNEDD